MANPMMSFWLSAANAWAGAAHAFWSAEMQRQQTMLLNEMQRQQAAWMKEMLDQGVRFWSGTWLVPDQPPQKPRLTLVQTSGRMSRS